VLAAAVYVWDWIMERDVAFLKYFYTFAYKSLKYIYEFLI